MHHDVTRTDVWSGLLLRVRLKFSHLINSIFRDKINEQRTEFLHKLTFQWSILFIVVHTFYSFAWSAHAVGITMSII